jgi:hypothetical protein
VTIIFGPQQVSLKANQPTVSPGIQIADNIERVTATLAHWSGTQTAKVLVEMSFDGGSTWRQVGATGPSVAPDGSHHNQVDMYITIINVWRLCGFTFPAGSRYRPGQVCGEAYFTGYPPQTTVHSDYAFQDTTGVPYDAITFHDPNLNPTVGGPLRQVRATITVSGNISSQLSVDAS